MKVACTVFAARIAMAIVAAATVAGHPRRRQRVASVQGRGDSDASVTDGDESGWGPPE